MGLKTIETKINNYNHFVTIKAKNLYKLEAFLNDTVHQRKPKWLLKEEILEALEEKLDNDESIVDISDSLTLAYEDKDDASSYKQLQIKYTTVANGYNDIIVNVTI